jgi:hypothetical protein
MSDVAKLRKKAALFRRVANIPTTGGILADRALHHLADRLDHDAAVAERQSSRVTTPHERTGNAAVNTPVGAAKV